jgi:hypothetical protein
MAASRKPGARKGPANQSRAAGAPAPKSAAATSPLAGAYYDPAPQDQPAQTAARRPGFKSEFNDAVRSGSIPLERGGSVDREVVEHMAAEAIHDPDDLAAEIARIRKFRKPIGAYTQKLALPERMGYHRHWFNDTAGRVEEYEQNGWAHVKGKDGKPISRCVGTGRDRGALYAYAMEIPLVFWLEEMALRNEQATDKVEGLKASPFRSAPGQAKPADRGKFYDPHEDQHDAGPLQVVKS